MDDCKKELIPCRLSAGYPGSFAFLTVRDRLPIILTRAIDRLVRQKDAIMTKYTKESHEELKQTIGRLSKLKNHIQTDKPLEPLQDTITDVPMWNHCLEEETLSVGGTAPTWFTSSWLLVECYMYRKVFEAFQLSPLLREHDPFADQKADAFLGSLDAIQILADYLLSVIHNGRGDTTEEEFFQILQIDLWGNKCDLSMSAGRKNSQKSNLLTQLTTLQSFILLDNTHCIWRRLIQGTDRHLKDVRLDLVMDNAGFELFTDLCFADYLCSKNLIGSVRFHVKKMPWFVSDTTHSDFYWMLQTMKSHGQTLADLGHRWEKLLDSGKWEVTSHYFWTLPHDFSKMRAISPDLYEQLTASHLVIFKGDLNYRKLTGDRKWETTVPFNIALRGFHPTPICALRILKADIIVGLRPNQAEETEAIATDWMTSGNFAVIQYWSA